MLLAGDPHGARRLFGYLHILGNGDATNNLGVLYLRGRGVKRDRKRAVELFEEAVEKKVVQARYNLVLTIPGKFETSDALIKRQYALLEENVALGDIPSHVLYAERLYFQNRERFVPNRQAKKLELLGAAAQTGDADYLYAYGKELEIQAFLEDDAKKMVRALRAYRSAFEKGQQSRAAEALGSARYLPEWNAEPSREEVLGKTETEWLIIAAEGSVTAKCHHGNRRFNWMQRTDEVLNNPSELQEMVNQYLEQDNPTPWELSIAHLEDCAEAMCAGSGARLRRCEATKLPSRLNPPFGDTALYARKRIGTLAAALVNSPMWATLYLGQIYALGIHVERDRAKAITYFNRLKTSSAKAWIDYLISHSEERQ